MELHTSYKYFKNIKNIKKISRHLLLKEQGHGLTSNMITDNLISSLPYLYLLMFLQ